MTSNEIRGKYHAFIVNKKHKWIPPAPLVPENDPTTLFTSSGMQPLVPYLLGQPHPGGKMLANSQPCFRSQDIEEVGDNRHTTFFEMLGNWSLGDYFKKEQLPWFWEFLTHELELDSQRLYVSIFKGNDQVPKDTESEKIWKSLGVPSDHIFFYGAKKNWWSRSGTPENMPPGEIGGPDSEVFYEFTQREHDKKFGEKCHPNCECGKFLEIGNSVFIQYQKQSNGSLKELPNKNVDFGGGLERLTAATINEPDVFKIDLFWPIIETIEKVSGKKYSETVNQPPMRIIADHVRGSVMLLSEGVIPSNKARGDILRSLISSAVFQLDNGLQIKERVLARLAENIVENYKNIYPKVLSKKNDILLILDQEELRFHNKIITGLPTFEAQYPKKYKLENEEDARNLIAIDLKPFNLDINDFLKRIGSYNSLASVAAGTAVFYGTSTYGLPFPTILPVIQNNWGTANITRDIEKANALMKELDREESRKSSTGMFKGGLADHSEIATKYHTATHLLHAALRKILGDHVQQKGSNITEERLRFDFSHPQKMTDEEIKRVEELVNEQIKINLPVTSEVMNKNEAYESNALGFFSQKYGDKVTVYAIGDFSREICGGPHVDFTGKLETFRIIKEESAGSGIRRIYATLGNYP